MSQLHCYEFAISEITAKGYTCEVVSHENQQRIGGNSSAVLRQCIFTLHYVINRSPETKPCGNNKPKIALTANWCRPALKLKMAVGTFFLRGKLLIVANTIDVILKAFVSHTAPGIHKNK